MSFDSYEQSISMSDYKYMFGGSDGLLDGGFPLFFPVTKRVESEPESESDEGKKKREFQKDNTLMNVHDILDNRKKVPFLSVLSGINDQVKVEYKKLNLKRSVSKKKKSKKT